MNRGFSGYTSRHLRSLLPRILSRDLVDGAVAATLFIGANDANDKDMNPQQYVPVEEYKVCEGLMDLNRSNQLSIDASLPRSLIS